MSMSQITVLKLRQLKPCGYTTEMLNSLLDIQGFGESMFQFDVKIPTKLWKALLRRRNLVVDGRCCTTYVTLGQVHTENDIDIRTYEDESVLDILNVSSSYVRHNMHSAVYVTPVNTELFDRFGIRVLRCVALFRGHNIINLNVALSGIAGSSAVEAIFDVSYFPGLPSERPSGALVSYTINI